MVARKSVLIDNSPRQGKCPEPDDYTLIFDRIEDFDFDEGFEGREPEQKFTLIFTFDYPEDPEFDGMEIKSWYTPKFRAIPGRQVPKLFELLKALNGGEYEQPEGQYDGWDELEKFVGRRFIAEIEPTEKGWPKIIKHKPLRRGKKKAAGSIEVVVLDPAVEDAVDERF